MSKITRNYHHKEFDEHGFFLFCFGKNFFQIYVNFNFR